MIECVDIQVMQGLERRRISGEAGWYI